MLLKKICRTLGNYLFYLAIALCIPLIAAIYYQWIANPLDHPQPHSTLGFLWTLALCLLFSFLLKQGGRHSEPTLYRRESILIIVLLWIATSLVSALPFYFSKTLTNPLDAYFEAISGLTTTGATVLCPKSYNPDTGEEIAIYITDPGTPGKTYTYKGTVAPIRDPTTGFILYTGIEAVSKALLLWRSLLQWIGGMGIVVIFLTVLPALGVGGKFLYQIEMTGPVKEGLAPRVRETAARLWRLYLFFTILEIFLLQITNPNMPFFDALCTSLSSISTGGFSVRNESIAAYHNNATEWLVMVFMIIGSINFSLFFHAIRLKFFRICVPDFFLFLGSALAGCAIVSLFLVGAPTYLTPETAYSLKDAVRLGCFQAVSMQTSTGFVAANYSHWPFPSQMFLLLLMFIGGMSGSTAGGIKTSRFYILYKIVLHRLESIYRPDSVRKLQISHTEIDDKNSLTVLSFFCIAAFFTVLGTVFFVLDGIDPETALGLTACFINNVGGAFQAAGPLHSFAFLAPFSKISATFWMLLGRLEFYVVLLLLLPSFWKNK